MKKLVIATDNFEPRKDGIARFLSKIIPSLKEHFDLKAIVPDFGKNEIDCEQIKIPLSNIKLSDFTLAKWKFKKIKEQIKKADIVFIQTLGPIGLLSHRYANKYNKKVVCYTHNIDWDLLPNALQPVIGRYFLQVLAKFVVKRYFNKADLILVPSNQIAEKLSYFNIKTKKELLTLGVDSKLFKPLELRSEKELNTISKLKKEHNLEDKFVIGYHGRIAKEKDLQTITRAFLWLKKQMKNAVLLIVGSGDLAMESKLKSYEDVIIISSTDTPELYLNLFSVYVSASLTETTSLSTIEALASSVPVVSTPAGLIPSYIKNKKNGLLFNFGNAFALYKHLKDLAENDALREKLRNNSRDSVIKNFDWNNTTKELIKMLSSL